MFPAGAAGCGLLILRMCAAGMLIRNVVVHTHSAIAIWEIAIIVILVGVFLLGAFTPLSCCASAAMQLLVVLRADHPDFYRLAFALCVIAALFFLGPGAFSLDSHFFGRRLIVHSNPK
jgi:hypothetical protein